MRKIFSGKKSESNHRLDSDLIPRLLKIFEKLKNFMPILLSQKCNVKMAKMVFKGSCPAFEFQDFISRYLRLITRPRTQELSVGVIFDT